ncbi:MAG: hypothetical protein NXI13_03335 [Proteobacteria bacterium]|nr:hypothetical protein [Pseudomonadota bacterium]
MRRGFFEEWANQTNAHPLGVTILVLCVIAVLLVRRQYAIFPLLILIIAIPSAQRVVLLTLDFSFIRILVIAGFLRAFLKNEFRGFKFQLPDKLIIWWMVWGIIAYTILKGGFDGTITRTGYMMEVVGAYFLGRIYINNFFDVKRIITLLGIASIPMFMLFLNERFTSKNLFSVFGGVPEWTLIRDGRLRCQGPFSHPIMAGVFWANLLPWVGALWFSKSMNKGLLTIYVICIIGIVFNTASSTPVMAIIFGAFGFGFIIFRKYMTYVQWGLLGSLIFLHLVMAKPVWHIIARLNVVGSSTGWHRYHLIDKAVENFGEWWLIGTTNTARWGNGLGDVTNQYVLEAVRGGLLGVVLFIVLLGSVFWLLGKAMRCTRNRTEIIMLWGSGTMLFTNVLSFFAASYFGQLNAAFFLFLGASVSLAATTIRAATTARRQAAPPLETGSISKPAIAGNVRQPLDN